MTLAFLTPGAGLGAIPCKLQYATVEADSCLDLTQAGTGSRSFEMEFVEAGGIPRVDDGNDGFMVPAG